MRNPKLVLTIVSISVLAMVVAGFVGLGIYAGSEQAKASLLVRYFRALSSGDPGSAADLTVGSFESDLALDPLARGSYELYNFGEPAAGTLRFLVILEGKDGKKRAVLGDMSYKRSGIINRIETMRRVGDGTRLKE